MEAESAPDDEPVVDRTRPSPWARWRVRVPFHALVAVLVTLPLAWRMDDGVPIGREPVPVVPWFNLWSWSWTADILPHSWSRWWDAPIFWPHTGTYANSELQPITGLVFGALRWATTPTVAYALVLLAALTLNGIAASVVAGRLGVSPFASAIAGGLAQVVPFAFAQLGVVQLLMLWPVLFATAGLVAWLERPTVRAAIEIGVSLSAAVLTCGYHATLFASCVLLATPAMVRRSWRDDWRRRLLTTALSIVIVLGIAGMFVVAQQRRLGDIHWTDDTITSGSATWRDLMPGGRRSAGLVLTLVGLSGAWIGRRRQAVRALTAMTAAALVLALGMRLSLFGWHPYATLVHHVDAFARLRSPFRATATAQVLLAVLSAFAIERLWARRDAAGRLVLAAAVAGVVWTGDPGSGPIHALPPTDLTWIEYLADHPGGAVLMLPPAEGRSVIEFEGTAAAMLQGLVHEHPLANGYSGFFPTGQADQRERWLRFPDAEVVDELRADGVRWVVADADWWTVERSTAAGAADLDIVLAGPDGVLIAIDA
ncbi:MAG: hypothetical protein U0Q03_04755 [Acidimicrobiales bacterium]